LSRLGRRAAAIHFLVLLTVGLCVSALFLGSGTVLVENMGRDARLTGRTDIWKALVNADSNPVLGSGFESFWLGERLDKIRDAFSGNLLNEAHNGYLEVYLNLGWVGLILTGLLLFQGYRRAAGAVKRMEPGWILRFLYVVITMIYSFTEAGFRLLSPSWIFFLLAATTLPEAWAYGVERSRIQESQPQLDHMLGVTS